LHIHGPLTTRPSAYPEEIEMELNAVVFDVNETLLDLAALDPLFECHMGSSAWRRTWFNEMLITAMTLNHVGRYVPFSEIGRASLATTAALAEVEINHSAVVEILDGMRTLPAHPDVTAGLDRLSEAGLRLVALTNSPPNVAEAQLEHAGLTNHIEDLITVQDSQCLKPAHEVYAAAEKKLAFQPGSLMLVAAHTWDIAGASNAGWQTTFLTRGHQIEHPLYPKPTLTAPDLAEAAEQIVSCLKY